MPLEKAKLTEIEDLDGGSTRVSGPEIAVQFNPASLKLSFTNKIETQETKGQQTRQFIGMSSTSLSFDLEFDTSDEGATDAPVSVRTRTAAIERFLMPKGDGKEKQKPPKARFSWNETVIDGIIESLAVDLTHFASDGTPLRAKMSVTMQEQNAKYQSGKTGPGANSGSGASLPGGNSAGPGSFGGGIGISAGASASIGFGASAGVSLGVSGGASAGASITDSTRMALAGESAAEFATRNGLDPAAWRGVTGAGGSSLTLTGGTEVNFSSSLSASGGVGVAVGVETGANASPEAKIGLDARGAVPTAAGLALGGVGASAGFALASAGGVRAAMETVNSNRAGDAASATKASFGEAVTASSSAPVEQSRAPLRQTGLPSASMQAAAPSAPPPPLADTRATTFGFGVPLRPLVSGAAATRTGSLGGAIPLRPNERASDALAPSSDPTAAPWTQLPVSKPQQQADAVQRARRPVRACGCHGPCTHRSQ
jgi:hypothetical protein